MTSLKNKHNAYCLNHTVGPGPHPFLFLFKGLMFQSADGGATWQRNHMILSRKALELSKNHG